MAGNRELELQVKGRKYNVRILDLGAETASVLVDGEKMEVAIRDVSSSAVTATASAESSRSSSAAPATGAIDGPAESSPGNSLLAMMPGTVLKLLVAEGQKIGTGDVILVLEAMKMENELRSDHSGTIGKVHVTVGQQVQTGDPLVSFS